MKTYGRKKSDEKDMLVNLDELCRLCLAREEQLIPIFGDKEIIPLPIRIMACVSLEVLKDDGLPSMICHRCHFQLKKYYVFRKKCESSDHKLRTHLKYVTENIKPNEDTENETISDNDLTAVTLVIPEDGESDGEQCDEGEGEGGRDITLPEEGVEETRSHCTLDKRVPDIQDTSDQEMEEEEEGPVLEASELDAVATAVRASLNGEVQEVPCLSDMRLVEGEGGATHVEVLTEDGSVLLMELTVRDPDCNTDATENLLDENGELRIHQCAHCPKAFARRVQLKRHSSVHTTEKGVSCSLCEKWFPSRSALTRHERIHTGERPFQCGVCGRSFAQKEILYRHFLIHSENKPFECDICNKGFTQKEALRSHMSTHSETPSIKVHKCTLCPKIFCHASGLSRHLITHTGRSYKCLDCEKSFSDKSSLKRHHKMTGHQANS